MTLQRARRLAAGVAATLICAGIAGALVVGLVLRWAGAS